MQKKEIEIAGYKITQLSEIEFEAENKEKNLDFYFEINEEDEVDTFVFDRKLNNKNAFLFSFTESNLSDAIVAANSYSR